MAFDTSETLTRSACSDELLPGTSLFHGQYRIVRYINSGGFGITYLARDRLLVAIGPDAQAEQLVRTGKRIADALDAEWTAVYVETPALQRLSDAERARAVTEYRALGL